MVKFTNDYKLVSCSCGLHIPSMLSLATLLRFTIILYVFMQSLQHSNNGRAFVEMF